MLVAISQRHEKSKHGMNIDILENSYVNYLERLGVLLISIPNISTRVNDYFEKFPISGVILTGGNSINPKLYRENGESADISNERDSTERKLINIAIKKKLPVLGICRGCQFINVYFGGKLKYMEQQLDQKIKHVASNHGVEILDNELKELVGNKIVVNSYHKQGITEDALSDNLKIFAMASDKTVEGIYHKKLPIAGIIWHPERTSPNVSANKIIMNLFMERRLFWKKI